MSDHAISSAELLFGIEVLANDPIPANRQWQPVMRSPNVPYRFESEQHAALFAVKMLDTSPHLELRLTGPGFV